MARRPYRMTPARRAALRKAQIAAAKKRRRKARVKNTAGVLAVTVGAATVGGYARSRHNKTMQMRYDAAHAGFVDAAMRRGKTNAHRQRVMNSRMIPQYGTDRTTFGRTRIGGGVTTDRLGRQRGNAKGLAGRRVKGEAAHAIFGRRAFKTDSKGITRKINRVRGVYDFGRRIGYDSGARHKKYLEIDKPLRQRQAAARRQAKGKHG